MTMVIELVSHFREISPNTGWFSYNKNWRTQTVRNFLCLKGVIFYLNEFQIISLQKWLHLEYISWKENLCFDSSVGHFICLPVSWLRPHALTDRPKKYTQIYEQMVKFLTKITSFYHNHNVYLYLIDLLVFVQNYSVCVCGGGPCIYLVCFI